MTHFVVCFINHSFISNFVLTVRKWGLLYYEKHSTRMITMMSQPNYTEVVFFDVVDFVVVALIFVAVNIGF